jgi:hypothetical protein
MRLQEVQASRWMVLLILPFIFAGLIAYIAIRAPENCGPIGRTLVELMFTYFSPIVQLRDCQLPYAFVAFFLILQPHLRFASLVVCAAGAGLVAAPPS